MWFSPSTRFGQKSTSNTPSQKNHQSVIFYFIYSFDYLKVDAVMFINYFSIYVCCNHKNYLTEEGNENYFSSDLRQNGAIKVVFIPPLKVIDEQKMRQLLIY